MSEIELMDLARGYDDLVDEAQAALRAEFARRGLEPPLIEEEEPQVEDDDGETMVRFSGTHRERGVNVDILTEMIAVMNASRAYESNASLFDTGKQLAEKTIELGRL